ncbi:sulfatase [Clostridium sp. CAG:1193]|nr:sulfatase [Clostridium sp. CAG:1193]
MNKKKIMLIIFWIFTVISFECIYRMTLFKNILDSDFIQMIIFCLPVSILLYIITTLFSEKANKKISTITLLLVFFIFAAQMVYFKVYNSVFSVYSMTNGGQVFEFWRTILSTIIDNIYNFICLLIPVVLYFIIKNKLFDFSRNSFVTLSVSLALYVFLVSVTFTCINLDKKAIYSSYNLYFNTHAPILSSKKFGLLTTMTLDLNRSIFGMNERKIEIIIDDKKPNSNNSKDSYNITDIDFDNLIDNEDDEIISLLHKYFRTMDGTKKNEYTGMFKGKNVIFFLAESLDPIAIDKDLTPTLYKLANSGFNFTNYYTPLYPASTADGEFRTEWSLISSRGDTLTLYANKDVYSPYLFVNSFKDYNINVYHNYNGDYYNRKSYFDSLGYKNFKSCYYGLDLPCNSFHESDLDMVDITTDDYMNSDTPFFSYYITLSGHMTYSKTNKLVQKNWDLVKDLDYSDKVKGYLASNIELDKALELLINRLESSGKLDDTVIVLTPDHYPYGLSNKEINEISETNRDDDFELYHSDLIIWNNTMEKAVTVTKVGSNPDVLPTLLNLFGIEYDSRFIIGQDLLSDSEGLVVFANRSFITDKIKYNSVNNSVISIDGKKIDETYINYMNNLVDNQFKISNLILQTNYYEKVFKPNDNYIKNSISEQID